WSRRAVKPTSHDLMRPCIVVVHASWRTLDEVFASCCCNQAVTTASPVGRRTRRPDPLVSTRRGTPARGAVKVCVEPAAMRSAIAQVDLMPPGGTEPSGENFNGIECN